MFFLNKVTVCLLAFDLTGCAQVNDHEDTLDDDIDFLSAMHAGFYLNVESTIFS